MATLAEDASVEVARFDAELGAEVARSRRYCCARSLPRPRRSKIGGAKSVALAELGSKELGTKDEGNATEIVGNVAAMVAALGLADRLEENAVLAMHRALLSNLQPDIAGRWREEQVWIGRD